MEPRTGVQERFEQALYRGAGGFEQALCRPLAALGRGLPATHGRRGLSGPSDTWQRGRGAYSLRSVPPKLGRGDTGTCMGRGMRKARAWGRAEPVNVGGGTSLNVAVQSQQTAESMLNVAQGPAALPSDQGGLTLRRD